MWGISLLLGGFFVEIAVVAVLDVTLRRGEESPGPELFR